MQNDQNDNKTVVGSFFVKLTKIYKRNQGRNVLHIRVYDATHIRIQNFVEN